MAKQLTIALILILSLAGKAFSVAVILPNDPKSPCWGVGVNATPIELKSFEKTTDELLDGVSKQLDAADKAIGYFEDLNIKSVVEGQSATFSMVEALFLEIMETSEHYSKEQAIAELEIQKELTFGPLSQAYGADVATIMASNVQTGNQTTKELTVLIAEDIEGQQGTYKSRVSADAEQYSGLTMAYSSPEKMYPITGTISEEDLPSAKKMISLLIDPSPTLALPENSSPAKAVEFNRNLLFKKGYLATPLKVEAERLAFLAPTTETASWKSLYEESLGETIPEKISTKQFIDLQVRTRTNNPVWQDRITNTVPVGLWKERILLRALQLEIARRQDVLLTDLLTMLEFQHSRNIKKTIDPALNEARSAALVKQ